MRTLLIITGLALTGSLARADDGPPPVTHVVLYPDSGLLTRSLDVTCDGEAVTAVFANLPPNFDHESIRAAATGANARVDGVSIRENIRERPYAADVDALEKQIEAGRVRILAVERQIERSQTERQRTSELMKSIAPFIDREAAMQPKPNTAAWGAALDQARAGFEEADKLYQATTFESRVLQRKQRDLQRRRDALGGAAPRRSYEADVVLHCSAGRVHVDLSYMTHLARWSPAYEARADVPGHSIELSVLANVTQSTGEAWHDVDVTLSTAQARRNAQPPKLQRLYLTSAPKVDTKKVLVRRDEVSDHLEATATGESDGKNVEAADQGVSVQLTVPGKAEILGDGRPSRLVVQKLPLEATFSLVAVPKLLPYVLTRGEARNAAKYPLLPGPVSLFSKGSYFGTTSLERIAEDDTIKLAFGIDEDIQVRRSLITEQKVEPGLLSSTRRLHYGYRIELASSSAKPSTLEVQEQIPVSEMDDVKVLVEKETTPGFATVATDGLLTWPVTLGPNEKKQLELRFTVEVPAKYDSAGL